jgi:hypothetical protein
VKKYFIVITILLFSSCGNNNLPNTVPDSTNNDTLANQIKGYISQGILSTSTTGASVTIINISDCTIIKINPDSTYNAVIYKNGKIQ